MNIDAAKCKYYCFRKQNVLTIQYSKPQTSWNSFTVLFRQVARNKTWKTNDTVK